MTKYKIARAKYYPAIIENPNPRHNTHQKVY